MPKFCAVFLVVFLNTGIFSQTNPFFISYTENTNPEHWMFSLQSDSITGYWTLLDSLPQALYGVNAYYWSQNNKVFICGGNSRLGVPSSQCWWYNIQNNTYEPAASLPHGRWSGKLVRVKDSLYLVGSIDSTFTSADGIIFRYSLNQNSWVIADTMPQPWVHECAVVVINDSLIAAIGGSVSSFLNPRNYVRVFNPHTGNWKSSGSVFPVNNTTAHAEYLRTDTTNNIIVLGGYGSGVLNTVFKGAFTLHANDSIAVSWSQFDTLNTGLFGQGVYRVAGARWNNDNILFGPALSAGSSVNQIWSLKYYDSNFVWTRLLPNTADTAANISTYGVKSGADTNYIYLFGGYKNPNVLSTAQKYTFAAPPPPIGINNTGGKIPVSFSLFQNYPNPFNPATKIRFDIPANVKSQTSNVKLIVYDILGREAAILVNDELRPGTYEVEFNMSGLSSGIYFYRMSTSDFTHTMKMILVK